MIRAGQIDMTREGNMGDNYIYDISNEKSQFSAALEHAREGLNPDAFDV